MNTLIDNTLSGELQEIYLENEEWLSEILFMEDEMHFLQNLMDQVFNGELVTNNLGQMDMVSMHFHLISERRKQLRLVLNQRTHKLEQLLNKASVKIGLEFIEEDATIVTEIKALINAEKLLKQELFSLILLQKDKSIKKSKHLKVPRFPLL